MTEIRDGKLAKAEACFGEADELAAATTNADVVSTADPRNMLALAWRGGEATARTAAAGYIREAIERGQGGYVCYVRYSLAVLELGLGNYAAALSQSHEVFREDPVYLGTVALPELVEAATRAGDRCAAVSAVDRLAERVRFSGTVQGSGLLARSRALVADDEDAEQLYRLAIDRLSESRTMGERARAHLLYGEWRDGSAP